MIPAAPLNLSGLSVQPSRPIGKVIALPSEDVVAANGITLLAALVDLVRALSRFAGTPHAGNRTPFVASEIYVVAQLYFGSFVVGFQILGNDLLRRCVRLIPIKLLPPFVVGAVTRALRVFEIPELLRRSQFNPPLLCIAEIEKVISGYQQTGVCLRARLAASRDYKDHSNDH